jgi:hypothetical protein
MATLIIKLDIDVDPAYEDPQEVANDLLYNPLSDRSVSEYAGHEPENVRAEWADG